MKIESHQQVMYVEGGYVRRKGGGIVGKVLNPDNARVRILEEQELCSVCEGYSFPPSHEAWCPSKEVNDEQ